MPYHMADWKISGALGTGRSEVNRTRVIDHRWYGSIPHGSSELLIGPLHRNRHVTCGNSRNPESPRFLIKLSSPADKFKVLRSCTALRGREISVSEDLTPKQQARRKELVPELRRRRKAGEIVFLRGDRLFKKETPTSAPRLVTTSPETQ